MASGGLAPSSGKGRQSTVLYQGLAAALASGSAVVPGLASFKRHLNKVLKNHYLELLLGGCKNAIP